MRPVEGAKVPTFAVVPSQASRAKQAEARAKAAEATWAILVGGLEDIKDRVLAGRGDAGALQRLQERRDAGDSDATPYHPTPSALRAIAQTAAILDEIVERAETRGSPGPDVELLVSRARLSLPNSWQKLPETDPDAAST